MYKVSDLKKQSYKVNEAEKYFVLQPKRYGIAISVEY